MVYRIFVEMVKTTIYGSATNKVATIAATSYHADKITNALCFAILLVGFASAIRLLTID